MFFFTLQDSELLKWIWDRVKVDRFVDTDVDILVRPGNYFLLWDVGTVYFYVLFSNSVLSDLLPCCLFYKKIPAPLPPPRGEGICKGNERKIKKN